QTVIFNAPVAGEIEHRFLAKPRRIEIALVHQKFDRPARITDLRLHFLARFEQAFGSKSRERSLVPDGGALTSKLTTTKCRDEHSSTSSAMNSCKSSLGTTAA